MVMSCLNSDLRPSMTDAECILVPCRTVYPQRAADRSLKGAEVHSQVSLRYHARLFRILHGSIVVPAISSILDDFEIGYGRVLKSMARRFLNINADPFRIPGRSVVVLCMSSILNDPGEGLGQVLKYMTRICLAYDARSCRISDGGPSFLPCRVSLMWSSQILGECWAFPRR